MRLLCHVFSMLLLALPAFAGEQLSYQKDDLYIRVVDVGAGECCVLKLPGNKYVVYDAGNWEDGGHTAITAIREVLKKTNTKTIELLVLSHTDADHLAATSDICNEFKVKRILHSGLDRNTTPKKKKPTGTWKKAMGAIEREVASDGAKELNLAKAPIEPGTVLFKSKGSEVTFVCGFEKPLPEWNIPEAKSGEFLNSGSIVVRVAYNGKSVLFCGDTVGRFIDDPESTCIAAEKFMVDRKQSVKIDSDVMIAPHHGADNGSSLDFINAVSPEYVIFSSGHEYSHPRKATALRYLSTGVKSEKMLRTDRGDDEGADEWDHERVAGTKDDEGDDDVEILVSKSGDFKVDYKNKN